MSSSDAPDLDSIDIFALATLPPPHPMFSGDFTFGDDLALPKLMMSSSSVSISPYTPSSCLTQMHLNRMNQSRVIQHRRQRLPSSAPRFCRHLNLLRSTIALRHQAVILRCQWKHMILSSHRLPFTPTTNPSPRDVRKGSVQ